MAKQNILFFIIFNLILLFLSLKFKFLIYAPLALIGSFIFYKAVNELFEGEIGTEFFLIIASIVGILGHEEWATVIILLIMLVAYYIEEIISEKTDQGIENILNLLPTQAILKIGIHEKNVEIKDLKPQDIIIVKTGATIPVDGIIIDGLGLVNSSTLTGESKLETKTIGDKVFAATFVESGYIIVKVETIGENTFFGKIKKLIEVAEEDKPNILLLTDKIARYLVPIILLFILIVWLVTRDAKLTITLLVFGSPLELVIIIPLALISTIIAGFKNGIIIKNGKSIELLAKMNDIMFDKTGTLTTGDLTISQIIPEAGYTKHDILKIAAIAEKRSMHPIAKAILSKAKTEHIVPDDPEEYINVPEGLIITYKNIEYKIGNFINNLKTYTSVDILKDNKLIGKILLVDKIREQSGSVINFFNNLNIDTYLLTGDNKQATNQITKDLNIKHVYTDLFPDKKLEIIKQEQNQAKIVAMVGDGINDAPALKQANIGIVMGSMGIEPAIKAADIVLLSDNLEKLIFTYKLSKKTISLIKQTIFIGFFAVHFTGMMLALYKIISPIQAALLHAILDILFLLNNLRLIYYKD